MAAPITNNQAADLAQYKDLIVYLTTILDNEAILDTPQLSSENITKMNDNIGLALDNISTILAEAGEEPTTTVSS